MELKKIFRTGLGAIFVCAVFLQWNGYAAEADGGFVAYPRVSSATGPVLFSHRAHGLRGAGYVCDKCHAPSNKGLVITMDDIRNGQACGSCHVERTKGPRSQTAAASIQDCSACHMPAADIIITLNRMDPVAFSHIRHLAVDPNKKSLKSAGFSCSDCHPVLFERISKSPVGMEVPHESGGCTQCHNGKKRADGIPSVFAANTRCLTCHKPAAMPVMDEQ